MLCLVVLGVLVGGAVCGRSPNADYVERTLKTSPEGRYSTDIQEDAELDVPGLAAKYGYPLEVHEVTTSDDYILTLHRIPHGRDKNNKPGDKPVVYIMHGLLSSSADFLLLGPGSALAYYLAEEGYDVWLGNARGNFYSRRHRRLNPDAFLNQAFWRFSWDEIGNLDLPASIDYILSTSKQSKLHYIGHSQGGTIFLVLNSLRPEYNEKFISFQGLAPAAIFTNNDQPVFKQVSQFESAIETAAFAMGRGEVFNNRDFLDWFISNYCVEGSIFEGACDSLTLTNGSDNINKTMLPVIHGHVPAGASIRQVTHYAQSIRFDTFRRFNYNRLTNLLEYGSTTPPSYDLSKITVPAYIHYAVADTLVHYKDTLLLCDRLANTVACDPVPKETFGHLDFTWGNGVKGLLYDKMLQQMRNAENNQF